MANENDEKFEWALDVIGKYVGFHFPLPVARGSHSIAAKFQ